MSHNLLDITVNTVYTVQIPVVHLCFDIYHSLNLRVRENDEGGSLTHKSWIFLEAQTSQYRNKVANLDPHSRTKEYC